MTLALTVADNLDGTGGVANVSGSLGATNDLYYASFTGSMTQINWGSAGSRVGDGSIPLALATGYYLFQLMSGGALGPGFYRNFSDATIDPMHFRILNAMQARINQLAMVDINRVLIKWVPRFQDPELPLLRTGPMIMISPPGVEIDESTVANQDDFGYPVLVAVGYAQNMDSVANLRAMLGKREKIMRAVRYQALAGIVGNLWVTPKPLAIIDPDEFTDRNLLVSAMGFSARVRQTRGLT